MTAPSPWLDGHWHESGLDALRETLAVSANERKAMIEFLYEEGFWDHEKLTWPAAISRWNDCLNPEKPTHFKLSELWALMLRFDRHQMFVAMAQDLGYAVRRYSSRERQEAMLVRLTETMALVQGQMDDTRRQIERLAVQAKVEERQSQRHMAVIDDVRTNDSDQIRGSTGRF